MTSDNNKKVDSSIKKKDLKEIEIEQKDLFNVFFDKSSSQFESQLFLSRKRMLSAENGQTELSELLKSKLKALDMMLFILSNNKNILKESDLSCCEVLNNLLCISKKDKSYGEHIYSKIKNIILYIIKNQLSLKEKNIETIIVIIKFLITLFNIKFDNGYFKQALDIISTNEEISKLFINELFDKLFKGRNITIKLKEMKYIIKTILFDAKIRKFIDFFEILEKLLSYAHEKDSGGCRTSFQLNQIVFLLQYLIDILNIKEIKQNLPEKKEINIKLLKILNIFNSNINEFVDKNDYMQDNDNISKKEMEAKNEKIKRKKTFFSEMYIFYNKTKSYFKEELIEKEFSKILEEINNLYKNIISTKYIVLINLNEKKDKKNKYKKIIEKAEEVDKRDNDNEKEEEYKDNKKKDINKNKEIKAEANDNNEEKNENKGIELDEGKEEKKEIKEKNKKGKDDINSKEKINIKEKKKSKNNKENKNKKKKEH